MATSVLLSLWVLAIWFAIAALLASIGISCVRMMMRWSAFEPGWEDVYWSIWIGLSVTVLGLLLWHFFQPVNQLATSVFVIAGAACLVVQRRTIGGLCRSVGWGWAACMGLAAVWIANHALGPPGMDDFNYEFQSVRWIHDYHLVPGLANLHGRLGFNNSHHLLAALWGVGFWEGRANHVVNGFVVALSVLYTMCAARSVFDAAGTSIDRVYPALLMSPCVGLVLFGIFGPMMPTLKADVFVSAGIMMLSCAFLRASRISERPEQQLVTAVAAILMSALLFTVKTSAAAFCAVLAIATIVWLWGRRPNLTAALAMAASTAVLLLAAHMARGIVLSGYPLYPWERLSLPVDWRVPITQVVADRMFIRTWAQLHPTYDFTQLARWTWLPNWIDSLVLTEKFTIILPLAMTAVLISTARIRRLVNSTLICACAAALVVWFVQAPAPRFASAYFWVVFASVAAPLLIEKQDRNSNVIRAVLTGSGAIAACQILLVAAGIPAQHRMGVLVVVAFGVIAATALRQAATHGTVVGVICVILGVSQIAERTSAHLLHRRFKEAATLLWLPAPKLPEPPNLGYDARSTRSGLTIYVTRAARYDTPLPNTRYFNTYLELRHAGRLDGGFRSRVPHPEASYGYSIDFSVDASAHEREVVRPAP